MSIGIPTEADNAGFSADFLTGGIPDEVSGLNSVEGVDGAKDKVHIRCQQRNGRKCITSIAGLHQDLDFKRLLKAFKKKFSCNGNVVESGDLGTVLQLQGDQRENARSFLTEQGIVTKSGLVTHGF
eukprot:TRINITY_DN410_c0_g1_i14.p3 TRINITY_DN410_c0_g1~~TRINITY_DN410_c0_g1_i14.p3  ORF type:complete len:126 (+),score=36.60 TRINITY_DN410_c0_g1_i14:69-446(+)